jgi:cell wall-associated NlpC family hydrolase
MSFQRIASAMVCVVVVAASSSLSAQSFAIEIGSPSTSPSIGQIVPDYLNLPAPAAQEAKRVAKYDNDALFSLETPAQFDATITSAVTTQVIFRAPRKRVADFAMRLRDVRYVRGGHDPKTGFDCSGFTHYVYNQTYGLNLPYDAPSQFRDGKTIPRERMRTGDLVFFQVGKRITHVGIYLEDGHFIHSPRPGKSVRVDSLDSAYWAKRFAGAKRPEVIS